jgi:ABC-type nitrate/sulfonate/bicarbonate transport system substrate-binding protein
MRARARTIGIVAVIGALSLVAASCSSSGSSKTSGTTVAGTVTVKVGGIGPFSVTAWPLVIATRQGYFAKEGIRLDQIFTFDGGQLLAGGKINVLNDGGDSGLLAAQAGKDAIAFSSLANRLTDGILVRSDITSVAQLAGKTLRTSGAGSTDEFVLQRFLKSKGIDPSKVKLQPVQEDGAAIAQLQAGNIDGGMYDQGLLFQAEQGQLKGTRALVPPAELGVYPWNVLQTTRSYATAHAQTLVGFVRAVEKAIAFIRDPANKATVIDAVLKSDKTLVRKDIVDTYDAAKTFALYQTTALTAADIQPAIDFVKTTQSGKLSVTAGSFIDNTYFDKAVPTP